MLRVEEVIVRVSSAPGAPGTDGPLGESYIDAASGTGVLATIFGDRIYQAAARVREDAAVMLGRALAHEVGHLLIGTTHHSARG